MKVMKIISYQLKTLNKVIDTGLSLYRICHKTTNKTNTGKKRKFN